MSGSKDDPVSSLSELAVSFPNAGELTATDLSDGLRSQFADAAIIRLGEASHGTQEFFELRFRLTRLLVEEFGVRAIGIEAGFDPLCRVAELVGAVGGCLPLQDAAVVQKVDAKRHLGLSDVRVADKVWRVVSGFQRMAPRTPLLVFSDRLSVFRYFWNDFRNSAGVLTTVGI
ncbi:hypothetical protein [Halorubrum sp. CBA1229]|uniref:hypothetical protein n=1 Tax=Halorubrum sp. CBA1229 TaxID=1853699 RepID=UPI0015945D2C|nr:hypothetical protein [Halorubrum sp. CBA1229]QKY18670.1 hypothetical protein Hrr1229_017325 [Halorubrum sp. CBA1229]